MKIFDIFKRNKNTQEKKDPIINDRTINFEIKFDNSKEKYINTAEGILKLSIKNATEIFRQTIKRIAAKFFNHAMCNEKTCSRNYYFL